MAFTYDLANLAISELYQVRFKIGDTDSTDPLLADEEVSFQLVEQGSVLAASISCCESIAAKYARKADYSLGPYSIKASQTAAHYNSLAKKLRANSVTNSGAPIFTGPEEDSAIFDIDMMNYAGDNHTSLAEEE